MATPLSQAWHSLQSGDLRKARQSFQNATGAESNDAYVYLGLAATSLAMANLRDALSYAEQSLEHSQTPEADLLLGEIYSRMGRRQEAEEALQNYVGQVGESAYGRALLGEQKLRTGRWDSGIDDFVEAMNQDSDGRAYRHLQRVVSDLVDAVADRKIPAKPASECVNKLDYNISNPPAGASQFFASARRALNNGRRIQQPEVGEPIFELLGQVEMPTNPASEGSDYMTSQPSDRRGPPSNQSPPTNQSPPQRSERRSKSRSRGAGEGSGSASDSSGNETGIDPKQKDLAGVIQNDRAMNEELQDAIGAMPAPEWPSSTEKSQIDPLASMAWKDQSIFSDAPDMDATDFRITSGSVLSEIFLERCLQNLLAGAKQDRAVSVRFRPEAITRIEVNCWDGLLDRLPPLSPIYEEFHQADNYKQLALGRFIGECVAVPYDGTWKFTEPPEESKLIIGNETLDPFGLADRWVGASDADAIALEELTEQAARAARSSSSLTVEQNYIDPTRELKGQSLSVKLAELWSSYVFRLGDASFAEIAETIEPRLTERGGIVCTIDPKFCPDFARGARDGAVLEDGSVPLGYLRETGEFLLLSSRKHAARCAQAVFEELTMDNASEVASYLRRFHRPGWYVVADESMAREVGNKTDLAPSTPQFYRDQSGRSLQVQAVVDRQLVTIVLQAPSRSGAMWSLQVE